MKISKCITLLDHENVYKDYRDPTKSIGSKVAKEFLHMKNSIC